jgi:uncharacterized protein (DUF433 family)
MGMEEKSTDTAAAIIQTDPLVLLGKPFVRGTRLSAEFLQGLVSIGWTAGNILEVYTYLSSEDLRAALAHPVR